jgi:hypothetical protein
MMNEYLKQLSEDLVYIKYEIIGDTLKLYCESKKVQGRSVHSRKMRVVKDVPYGKYKVELHLLTKKYFNHDPNEEKLTKAETYTFINSTGRRTKRLDKYILDSCKETSAIGCERFIREHVADVSDTSILRLLKKKRTM